MENSFELNDIFRFDPALEELAGQAMELCKPQFAEFERRAELSGRRVLGAFIDNRIGESDLKGTNGYGYGDSGRDKLDSVFARILGTEDALVRHNFVNGTHAITTALFGVLRMGDTLLSVTGEPYDTIQGVINGEGIGSLKDFGIKYEQVDLLPDGTPDYEAIAAKAAGCKVAYIQRSRGYSLRPSFTVEVIGKV
ncbi:MAG: methionine gamma-lyase family protein, partial [Oscillospiraceae bacterium]|nr:methionine gamma-lyase family protein [Oscillospiraceae bacterium]